MKRTILPLAAAAAIALPAIARADDDRPHPIVAVTGEGEASVKPDMALVTLAVMREADTARAALDQTNEAMAAVIAAMKEAGIAERDLQTSGLSIQPHYVYPQNNDGSQQPRLVGYQVSNSLNVRVRDLGSIGEIVDRSVTLGVNQGGQIIFGNDDPSATRSEARRKAVEDAIAKARELAQAAGVSLGPIREISEQSSAQPPMPIGGRIMRMEAKADAVPVEAGENTYRVEVNVTFELAQ